MRPPVSLCVIAMDEEDNIADCLGSADFVAERIVVDSHSKDATRERAAAAGARVVERDWPGHVQQKNFAIDAASNDWVLCLDADERVSPELGAAISAALGSTPAAVAFAMARRNRFLGRWLCHGEGYPDWIVRLFDRRHARWTDEPVHENVKTSGSIARLTGDLLHASAESLDAYIAKQNRYTTIQAEAMHTRGERASVVRLVGSPLARFIRFYVVRLGFLDGIAGLVHIAIGCFASFMKYAKLRALSG
jgi:glycosyltransferase involved in cell wall biosynthesis